MAEKPVLRLVAESGILGKGVEGAAHGIAAIRHTALAFDQFEMVDGVGIDRVPVLHRTAPPRGVVEAYAVNQQQVAATGHAANERGAVTVGGFLGKHSGSETERIGNIAPGVFRKKILIQISAGVGRVGERNLGACCRDDQWLQQVLAVRQQRCDENCREQNSRGFLWLSLQVGRILECDSPLAGPIVLAAVVHVSDVCLS